MLKTAAAILISAALIFSAPAFAVDGQVLINQSTVMAAKGFPYKITQPGSYKLSGNLVVPAGVDGIDILTDGVTIDLNGFTISGPVTCTRSGSHISCIGNGGLGIFNPSFGLSAPHINVAVRNGSVVGFNTGIYLSESFNSLVEEVRASGNTDFGLNVNNSLVRRNIASENGISGISARNSTVTENVANLNGAHGLEAVLGMYGSNTFDGNGSGPVSNIFGAVSQNNNGCDGVAC
jgi:parallel beta-helix repeat protein